MMRTKLSGVSNPSRYVTFACTPSEEIGISLTLTPYNTLLRVTIFSKYASCECVFNIFIINVGGIKEQTFYKSGLFFVHVCFLFLNIECDTREE